MGPLALKVFICCLLFYLPAFCSRISDNSCDVNTPCSCCSDGGQSCSTHNDKFCEGPCKEGYWGGRCKSICPNVCLSCNQDFGITNECFNCTDGRYGLNCSNTCPQCLSCEKVTGVCITCAVRYYGTKCQHNCPLNCEHQHCNATSGRCKKCTNGYYGIMCNHRCSVTCAGSLCDRDSGNCHVCIDGYHGDNCNMTCKQTCLGKVCNMSSGICNECVHGKYGPLCNQACPVHCKDSLCDRTEGHCTNGCMDNFDGYMCAQCQTGKHGDDCSLDCPLHCLNGSCHRTTGRCVFGCIYGYSDDRFCCANSTNCLQCSSDTNCTQCTNGTYGLMCNNKCPVNCDGPCDRSTGDCIQCKLNDYGLKCDKTCSETCLKNNDQISRCDSENGNCTFGCTSGYYGNTCNHSCSEYCYGYCYQQSGECHSCKFNRFGTVCEYNCSQSCIGRTENETSCSKEIGDCLHGCIGGFFGNKCENNCSSGCQDNMCKQTSGECPSCIFNRFGQFCEHKCSHGCVTNVVGTACSKDNGNCLHGCVDGFYGDKCDNNCSSGCQQTVCNRSTGHCSNGCTDGFSGPVCTQEVRQATDILPATTVGVGVGVGVALVGVLILVIRKRGSKPVTTHRKVKNIYKGMAVKTIAHVKTRAVIEETEADQLEVIDEHRYYNTASLKLKTEELYRYLSKSDEDYQKEFLMLPTGLIWPYTDAKSPANAKKNRYNMVYPYDNSRVKVKDGSSDYINASYIDGYNKRNAYIACLGPTTKILGDFSLFWKMIWQEKVEAIVMVTKLKEGSGMKCDQYWPNAGKTMMYGNVKVISTSEEEYAEFVVRNMTLSVDKEERQFHHIHFTAWPDKGVPSDVISIVNLRNKVLKMRRKLDGPLVVHCSAGIGRTGTYIALDILIRQGQAEQSVDVLGCVIKMRQQRVHMVQTVDQYKYLHHAVLWSLSIDTEPIPADCFMDLSWIYQDAGLTKMLKQLQMENWYDTEEEKRAVEAHMMIPFANRENTDIPGSRHAVRVMRYDTNQQMKADYINAVFIDGYKRQNRFIAAQTPLPETVTQFLDMVAQHSVGCIIDLEPARTIQDDVGEYLPDEGQELQNGNVAFKTTRRKKIGAYVKKEIQVIEDGKVHSSRAIAHYQFTRWSQASLVPDSGEFVKLIHDVENLVIQTEQTGPILVHCMNGADRSALFCAMWLLIERIGVDYSVSVLNTLRQVKSRRRMAIPNEEQIEFCFKGVATHLNLINQNVYSNM